MFTGEVFAGARPFPPNHGEEDSPQLETSQSLSRSILGGGPDRGSLSPRWHRRALESDCRSWQSWAKAQNAKTADFETFARKSLYVLEQNEIAKT